jgi:hypothetical protein
VLVTIVVAEDDSEYRLLVRFIVASRSDTMRMSL